MNTRHVPARAIAALFLAGGCTTAAHAERADATDPVQVSLFAGAAYDDNIYRLEGDREALQAIGTSTLDDWYRYGGIDFTGRFAGDERRLDVDAQIYRQTYDRFDSLDHTGGHFDASGEWKLSDATRGKLSYGFERRLQSFTNKDIPREDMIRKHAFEAAIEHVLASRWQVRLQGDWADFNFSTSDFLDKQQLDGEAEIDYAASQHSTFGLLGSYTQSNFDTNNARDFSGWSLGPSFHWQLTSSFTVRANVGYTHRELEHPGNLSDYNGVTGFVSSYWSPGERFSSDIRVYRDVDNLGGEVSEYTERTGVTWQPRWQATSKLSTRLAVTYEKRDFSAVQGARNRKDDYFVTDLWLDFQIARRLLLSLGYTLETRNSNIDREDFNDNTVRAEARFTL